MRSVLVIAVRDARAEDAAALAELLGELGYCDGSQDVWSRIERMPSNAYRTLVAVHEGRVVGFIGLLSMQVYEHARPIGYILAMCVTNKK
jgi:hypothetical protein